eukprot:gene7820-8667_t
MTRIKALVHDQDLSQYLSNFESSGTSAASTTMTVKVSQTDGNNSISCIIGGDMCESLQYAYSESIHRLSPNVTNRIVIEITDDIYRISDALRINKPSSENLQIIEIISSNRSKNATLLSVSHAAAIIIGCNSTKGIPCIRYAVSFKNINFRNFQSTYPSVFLLFTAAKVSISDCEFSNNNCSAVNSLDTPVEIARTNFIENHGNGNFEQGNTDSFLGFPRSNRSSGGAIAFIFHHASNITVKVKNCFFHRNFASMMYQQPFIEHSVNDTMFPRVGGGMFLLFMQKSTNNNVYLSDSNFIGNNAYSGGGAGFVAESQANFNSLYISGCRFERNTGLSTAGGILIAVWDNSCENKIIVEDSHFIKNDAKFAAGIKLFIDNPSSQKQKGGSPVLEIKRTIFCSNRAETGSAMHAAFNSLYQQNYNEAIIISNSTFRQHGEVPKKVVLSNTGTLLYDGTILTQRVDIEFVGDNYIIANKNGCGLYASNANIYINGYVEFFKNTAMAAGGAMVLADISRLIFYPHSHLRFEENFSHQKGGALAVTTIGMPNLTYVYNPFCFLQYKDGHLPYSQWKMKLEFINNGAAVKAGAVFINTLTSCLWNDEPPHHSFEKALRWNDNFVYRDNYVDAMYTPITLDTTDTNEATAADIATDTSKLVLTGPKQVALSPGEKAKFHLIALDELGNKIHSVAMAESFAQFHNGTPTRSRLLLPYSYFVVTPYLSSQGHDISYLVQQPYYEQLFEDRNVSHFIQFSDRYTSFLTCATIEIKPVPCAPGFVYSKVRKTCVCNADGNIIKRCIGTSVLVKQDYWVVPRPDSNELITMRCPFGYCKCNQTRDQLNGCVYDYKHPNRQCEDGRTGTLCGSCEKGRGLSLHWGKCVPCDTKMKSVIILTIVVVVVLLIAVLIVYLNPNFSTKLRGPTFYLQILPYVFSNDRAVFYSMVRQIASFAALGGAAGLPFDGCLSESMDQLDVNALSYLFPAAVLLVLLAVYVLDRFYVLNFTRDSPFEAFWILLVGTYVFFSETSLIFYYCVPVGKGGEVVFFYDGSVRCYNGRHLLMILASSVVMLCFVILPPLLVVLMCFGIVTVPLQVVDALTKGLREPVRWWWSIDLIRRQVYVAVYVFIPYETMKKVCFIVVSIFFLALHAECQPYKSKFSNVSETFLLFSISMLATLQLVDAEESKSYSSAVFMVTFLYIFFLFSFMVIQFFRRRLMKMRIAKTRFRELDVDGAQNHNGAKQ